MGGGCTVWTYVRDLGLGVVFGLIFALCIGNVPPFNREPRDVTFVLVLESVLAGSLSSLLVTYVSCIGGR